MEVFMKSQDLFKIHKSSKRLNEALHRTFGKKINFENFDLEKLQDARNRLRTQISQFTSDSGFNENLENDTYHRAKFMLDAINAEIAEREEFIVDNDVEEGHSSEVDHDLAVLARSGVMAGEGDEEKLIAALEGEMGEEVAATLQDMLDEIKEELANDGDFDTIKDQDRMMELLMDRVVDEYGDVYQDDEGGETDDEYALASAGFGSDEDYGGSWNEESIELEGKKEQNFTSDDIKNLEKIDDINTLKDQALELISTPSARPMKPEKVDWFKRNLEMKTSKNAIIKLMYDLLLAGEGMRVIGKNRASQIYSQRFGDSIENKDNEMDKITEGEIQQAQSIVTAKTMVDRVGRWIEELSGMENDTLLQLGDQIRDEMGQEQAKAYITSVAPAIKQALDNLKSTREILASGVRTLTGEEQPVEMLGAEPQGPVEPEAEPAAPDEMNMGADEFAAAEPATGGEEAAGREKRESIEYQNKLMRVLAG